MVDYEPSTAQPNRQRTRRGGGRGQGRATGRRARGRGIGQVQQETALHVAVTLLMKKKRVIVCSFTKMQPIAPRV